jgi:NAD-dependent dihydropyrimidine dehydrogenase PreA subunit
MILLCEIDELFFKKGEIMAYKIDEKCVACGACVPQCPVDAIAEGTPFVINAETCIDCGACVSVCPTESISPA